MTDSVIVSPIEDLKSIVEKINRHPITIERVRTSKEVDEFENISLGDSEFLDAQPEDYQALINELRGWLDGNLITKDGQCNNLFYRLPKISGHKLRVVERDSFGPLCCGFWPEGCEWVIYYG